MSLQPLIANNTLHYLEETANYFTANVTGEISLDKFLVEILGEEEQQASLGLSSLHCDYNTQILTVYLNMIPVLPLYPGLLQLNDVLYRAEVHLNEDGTNTFLHIAATGRNVSDSTSFEIPLQMIVSEEIWTFSETTVFKVDMMEVFDLYNYTYDEYLNYFTSTNFLVEELDGGMMVGQNDTASWFLLRMKGTLNVTQLEGRDYDTMINNVEIILYHQEHMGAVPVILARIPYETSSPRLEQLFNVATNYSLTDELIPYLKKLDRKKALNYVDEFVVALQPAIPYEIDLVSIEFVTNVIGLDLSLFPYGQYVIYNMPEELGTRLCGKLHQENITFISLDNPLIIDNGLSVFGAEEYDQMLLSHQNVFSQGFTSQSVVIKAYFLRESLTVQFDVDSKNSLEYFDNFVSFNTSKITFALSLVTYMVSSHAVATVTVDKLVLNGNVSYGGSDDSFKVTGCEVDLNPIDLWIHTLEEEAINKVTNALTDLNIWPLNMSLLCYTWSFAFQNPPSYLKSLGIGRWPRALMTDEDLMDLLGENDTNDTYVSETFYDHFVLSSYLSWVTGRQFHPVVSLELRDIYLPLFFNQLFGESNQSNSFLLQNQPVAIVLDVEGRGHFTHLMEDIPLLSQVMLKEVEVQIVFRFAWPQFCDLDQQCLLLQKMYGNDTELVFLGEPLDEGFIAYANTPPFSIAGGITATSEIVLQQNFTKTDLRVMSEFCMEDIESCFSGDIGLDKENGLDIILSVTSDNCSSRLSDYSWLKACNHSINVNIRPSAIPLTNVGITSTSIDLGVEGCEAISGHGFFGLNLTHSSENYFMASYTKTITLKQFLEAYCYSGSLGRTLNGVTIEELDVSKSKKKLVFYPEPDFEEFVIPKGLSLTGMGSFFEYRGAVALQLDKNRSPTMITIEMTLPVLNLHEGSFLLRPVSSSDKTGPVFRSEIHLKGQSTTRMSLVGEVRILGLSVEAEVQVSESLLEVTVEGLLYNEFDVILTAIAEHRGRLSTVKFRCFGKFARPLLDRLENATTILIQKAVQGTDYTLNITRHNVTLNERSYNNALLALEPSIGKLNETKENVTKQQDRLNELEMERDTICTTEECNLGQ